MASKTEKRTDVWEVGASYLVRTVTNYITGKLVVVSPQELVFIEAAWVAETGRFSEALSSGSLNEVEPYPAGEVIVGRGAVIDACKWPHALPRVVK